MDRAKFKSLVYHIVSRRRNCPITLGAVKLNKILWLSDLTAFYYRGRSITNARYVKQQFGPVPVSVMPILRELEREGAITISEVDHFGKRKTEYIVHKPAPLGVLDLNDMKIVDGVIEEVCDHHTAKSISDASHNHIWEAAADGEEIPLYTVFARPGRITDADRQWAQVKLEEETAA